MNSLVLFPSEIDHDQRAVLTGERARDVVHRHAVTCGQRIRAAVLGGGCGSAVVEHLEPDSVVLHVSCKEAPPRRLDTSIIVAVPRPQTVKKVLHLAAVFGIRSVHFVRAARTNKSYLQSPVLRAPSIERELILGLEQSGDSRIPDVRLQNRFLPFIEDVVPQMIADGGVRGLLAAPPRLDGSRQSDSWRIPRVDAGEQALIAIGPEAGWNEFEVERFEQLGFERLILGARILRVETALAAAISAVESRR